MNYVFGPVPSRRLGQSLGIDPVPLKTCNWNCIYCQIGRTSPLSNERRIYVPPQDILDEVQAVLERHDTGAIDWLTFVGSGEPTLHAALGEMIQRLKQTTNIPVAVLTNGSLLHLPQVRADLARADVVLPSLDAGSETLYRKINRAVPELSLDRLVDGLVAFRAQFTGRLWVEVMLINGLNDSEDALRDLASLLQRIRPDEVHINLPIRPPAEPWVEVSRDDRIARAVGILGEVSHVVEPTGAELKLDGCDDVLEAVIGVITRHPMSEEDLVRALEDWNPAQVETALQALEASGRAHAVTRRGQRFWSGAEARYVDESLSRCHGAPRDASPRND